MELVKEDLEKLSKADLEALLIDEKRLALQLTNHLAEYNQLFFLRFHHRIANYDH